MNAPTRSRFEVPAIIIVDAIDAQDARARAQELSTTLGEEAGPGAFFCDIGVAPTDLPRMCEEDREEETVDEHIKSLREARG